MTAFVKAARVIGDLDDDFYRLDVRSIGGGATYQQPFAVVEAGGTLPPVNRLPTRTGRATRGRTGRGRR